MKAQPPRPAASFPSLYGGVEPLDAGRHLGLRLREAGHGFAREAKAVPIAAEEFMLAARQMPIVFGTAAPHMPLALLGLRGGANHFIDAAGAWRAGSYMPAYLRRHPFIAVQAAADSEQFVLCLDPTAPQLSMTDGEALFDEAGAPSAVALRALQFARAVEGAFRRTREMTEALLDMALLQPAVIQFDHQGVPFRVDGFHAIERERLMDLTGEQLVMLRDKGWLEPIHAHLLSLNGIADFKRLEG